MLRHDHVPFVLEYLQMGNSKKRKRHYMDEDQVSLYKGIRKPMPPKSRVHTDDSEKRKKRFDWRDELDND